MKNVKGNKRQWKRLMAILIVAVMLFTTPHIVGFASMGAEEASTTSANTSDLAVQSEEADTGDKSAQKEETKSEESQEQPVKSESENKQEEQKQASAPEEKQTEKKTETKSETKTEAEKKVEETKTEEKTTSEKTSATEESNAPEKSSEVQSTEEETTEESTEAISKEKKNFRYENDDVKILVKESEAGTVPDNVQLQVTPIEKDNKETQKQYVEVRKKLLEKAQNEIYDIAGFLAYDITFVNENGDKVEPDGKVQVSMEYKKITMPEELKDRNDSADTNVTVMHLEEDTTGKVKEVVDMSENKQLKDITTTNKKVVKTVDFETESFSTFTITWTRTNTQEFSFSENLYMVKAGNNTLSSYIDLNATVGEGELSIETEDTNPVLYFSTISSSGLNKNLYSVSENGTTYRFQGAYIATKANNQYTLVGSSEKIVKLTGRVENGANVMKYQYAGDTSYRMIQSEQYVVMVYTDATLTTSAKCCTEDGKQISNSTVDLSNISEDKFDVTKANDPVQNSFYANRITYTYKYAVVGTGSNSIEVSYLRKYNDGLQYSMDTENWYDVGSEPINLIYNADDGSKKTITTADTRGIIDIDMVNYQTNQTYEGLKFIGDGEWTGSAAVQQGIVANTLSNGYPVFSGNKSGTKRGVSLKPLFVGSWNKTVTGSTVFGANHLFTYNSTTGKYKYDSSKNYAYYDTSSNNTGKNFIVYDKKNDKAESGTSYVDGAFMPYSSWDDKTDTNMFAFGMRVGFDFTQPTGGKIKGQDMTFSFSGDDDVWIFIDNKLVMDMGGVHDISSGTINFRTGEVVINKGKKDKNGTSLEKTSSLQQVFGSIFADGTTHHLEMFYLERGRGASNCSLEFNIPPQTKDILEIKKSITNTDKEKYANVRFGFKAFLQDENTNGENPGDFEAIPKGTPFKVKKDGKLTGETRYVQDHNIFYLKSGESAVFEDINPDLKFYAEEVDISSDEFDEVTIPNWRVSYVDENGNTVESSDNVVSEGKKYIARSETKIVGQNALVEFKNRCSAANKRELRITKAMKAGQTTDDTFSFKIYLTSTEGNLVPYVGSYYLQDQNGKYYSNDNGKLAPLTDSGVAGNTDSEGKVTGIPVGYTVSITQVLSGTRFKVEEIGLNDNPNYKEPIITVENCDEGNTSENYVATGIIKLKYDASVTVTNQKNYKKIKVIKQWKDSDETAELENSLKKSTWVGLYKGNDYSVQPEQVKQLNASNAWACEFDILGEISEYTVKEIVESNGRYTVVNNDEFIKLDDYIYKVGYPSEENAGANEKQISIVNVLQRGSIEITKCNANKEKLGGAEFEITGSNGVKEVFTTPSEGEEKGIIKITNLLPGEYTITETKAPEHYNLLTSPIKVTVGTTEGESKNSGISVVGDSNTYYYNLKLDVINNKLFDMPEAGGGFKATIFGIAIMIIAGGWYLICRRRRIV